VTEEPKKERRVYIASRSAPLKKRIVTSTTDSETEVTTNWSTLCSIFIIHEEGTNCMTDPKEKKSKVDRSEILGDKKPIYETRQAPSKKRPSNSSDEN